MMIDKTLCPLWDKPCLHLRRLGGRCSDSPSLDDATTCISLSGEQIEELNDELGAMDEWVDQLRGQADDGSKGDGA